MTLTPVTIVVMIIGIPLAILLIAGLYLEKPDDDEQHDSSRYSPIKMHPILAIALAFAIPGLIGYLAWTFIESHVLGVIVTIGVPLVALNIIRLFVAKHDKKESEDQHQPAPTLRSHPPGVTTSHPRRTRVASAAKGR